MRLAIVLAAAALLAAPALAQEASKAPPPEGFYKNIPNAYDLLLRPQVMNDFIQARELQLMEGRRICPDLPANPTDKERIVQDDCASVAPPVSEFVTSIAPFKGPRK
jgi:hypothetical protein